MRLSILGVTIDNQRVSALCAQARNLCDTPGPHQIVTVNPEFIMAAQHDTAFRNILNRADLSVADGFGLTLAAWKFGGRLSGRLAGIDLMLNLCEYAAEKGFSVFLLGSQPGIAEKTAATLQRRLPTLHIVGAESGYRHWHRPFSPEKLIERINRKKPDILFVAFGQVKQEKWIYQALPHLSSVRVAMGVGGSFDYISGKVRRAPLLMRRVGLEWLFRLIRQPWRFARIFNAVILFSLRILFSSNKK